MPQPFQDAERHSHLLISGYPTVGKIADVTAGKLASFGSHSCLLLGEKYNTGMRDIGEGSIRRIDWTELAPVVLLLRVFTTALGLRILLIALIGLQLNVLVNTIAGISFVNPELVESARHGKPQFYFNLPFDELYSGVLDTTFSVLQLLLWLPNVVLIWVICGGMICRIVSLRLTIDESESQGNLVLFLRKRGVSLIGAPLLVLLAILCCFLPVKIAAWMLKIPFWNYVVALLFPIPFIFTCLTVFLALVLAIGWVLLFAAVSTDGSDGFDAVSRMFSYVCQRPLHYLFYWFCCCVLGGLGFALVQFLTLFAINLCWTTISANPTNFDFFIMSCIEFWAGLFDSLRLAYVFAWFWTSGVAIYLLLRRSVDATPFQEVYRVSPPKIRTLPTIKPDELGAPEIVPSTETPPQSP